jgi:hypothetical protein
MLQLLETIVTEVAAGVATTVIIALAQRLFRWWKERR